jgi:cell division protein FtsN
MKTCSVCGLHVEDDYLYCWEDGTPLNEAEAMRPPQSPALLTVPSEPAAAAGAENEEVKGQRVLYCPVCAGTFPLTFVACPIHDVPLTTRSLRQKATPEIRPITVEEPSPEIVSSEPSVQFLAPTPVIAPAPVIPQAPVIAPAPAPVIAQAPVIAPAPARVLEIPTYDAEETESEPPDDGGSNSMGFLLSYWDRFRVRIERLTREMRSRRKPSKRRRQSFDWGLGLPGAGESDPLNTPKGMRLAARATAISLILITLAGIYIVYSLVTRTPSPSSRSNQNNIAQQESPLIATPQEARDYRPEPELPSTSGTDDAAPGALDSPSRPAEAGAGAAPRTFLAAPARSGLANMAASSYDARPPAGGGRFNTRLVRVRSYRSPSGYRYTLTFTLYEQAGRSMQWERLSIVTQSANGATHTESLPFQYVLAGSGALTFTVNVEMAGTSEADWRGHISCMSIGADDSGRPLRASFGADVAPL